MVRLSGVISSEPKVSNAEENAEFAIVAPHHLATYFGDAFDASVAVQLDFLRRKLVRG
jgi:hypothetical protein